MSIFKKYVLLISIAFSPYCVADQVLIENYNSARTIFWDRLYPGGYTLYCGERFNNPKKAFSGKKISIEHVFAASWMAEAIGCGTRKQCQKTSSRFNLAEADLHNLYPVWSKINSSRNNLEFGIIADEKHRFGCDFERTDKIAEPREIVRGNIARAMLYMADEYGFKISEDMRNLMLEWHKLDPPSKDEIKLFRIFKGIEINILTNLKCI